MKDRIDTTADASSIERLSVDRGLCMTDQRRIIARVLSACHDHPDIEELHRRVRKVDTRISLSTIYRTVRLLCRKGIIEKHNFGVGRARLERSSDNHHHYLIDMHSGKVVEFRSDEIERLLKEIASQLGYRIVDHRLELYAVPIHDGRSARGPGRSRIRS